MSKSVVVVGSINLDLVTSAPRIPVPGETLTGTNFQTFFGGKGANQAVAAARLGHAVQMIGRVGTDDFGLQLKQGLESAGVDTTGIGRSEGASGLGVIVTAQSGENSIVVVPGANAKVLPSDLDAHRDLVRGAGILLAQLEVPMETVEYLARIAEESGIPLMLDPAPARALPDSLLRKVTWITPNETEARLLLDSPEGLEEQECVRRLQARGVKNVVLKLGSRGAYVATADGARRMVPGFAVEAVDTTAAGDAFNGAFAVAMMRGETPTEAARFANAVAALSVTRHGAQPSMPTQSEVDSFLQSRVSS